MSSANDDGISRRVVPRPNYVRQNSNANGTGPHPNVEINQPIIIDEKSNNELARNPETGVISSLAERAPWSGVPGLAPGIIGSMEAPSGDGLAANGEMLKELYVVFLIGVLLVLFVFEINCYLLIFLICVLGTF